MSTITPAAFARALNGSPTVKVFDVREPDEFAEAHLAGSINVPLERALARDFPAGLEPTPGEVFFLLCRSGKRAGVVADALKKAGLSGATVVLGGLLAWVEEGRAVYSDRKTTERLSEIPPTFP